ncbi:MAG: HAD-IA family hydrolase [Bacillota bacterium]
MKPIHKRDTIIFDMDGTLVDSAEFIIKCTKEMLEKMELPPCEIEDLHFIVGPPLSHTFVNSFNIPEARLDEALNIYRELYEAREKTPEFLFSSIDQMLSFLKSAGKTLAVATSKKETSARHDLKQLGIDTYFDFVAGLDEEVGRNSKAKVILHAMEQLGTDPEDAVMVGDRHFDVDGATEAGIPCIGVLYGYGDRDELLAAKAKVILKKPKDVVAYFLNSK